jgi:hypothetical protein
MGLCAAGLFCMLAGIWLAFRLIISRRLRMMSAHFCTSRKSRITRESAGPGHGGGRDR